MRLTADVKAATELTGKHPFYLKFSSPEKIRSMATITHIQFSGS